MVAVELVKAPNVDDGTEGQNVETNVAIDLRSVTKIFGTEAGTEAVKALDQISTNIKDCEFVSIIGPSGCGKSTLLRILAGLIPYEEGSVSLLGREIEGENPAVLPEVGVVFQTANLLPWLNVEANMRLGADICGHEISDGQLAEMIDTMGLQGFETRFPNELSGGMRHRVAIGQALIRNPRILLMDEPFGALDALTRDRLNVELLRLWQAQKKTVVLITHSISEAILLSDRVLVMSERPGRLIEEVEINLPRPRDPSQTRELAEFGDYVVQLSKLMGVV